MSEPIKIGDLVMVVKSCCPMRVKPTIFVVERQTALSSEERGVCADCGASLPADNYWRSNAPVGEAWGQPEQWLKKIPPMDELNSVDKTTNLDEPAHA